MFNITDVKILHLEPTNICNAACPQCSRNDPTKFNQQTDLSELTLEQIKTLIPENLVRQLEKVFMCGIYGDPASASECLDICRYFRSVNPDIVLGMNTNGSLRSTAWWAELAGIFNKPKDYVIWSIDGLADTNHIYRVNTRWNKIMENSQAYISAGGSAHWDMLVFEHNEHQVDQAHLLAQSMGFKWFRAKVSRRHHSIPVSFLKPPKSWVDPTISSTDISCHALKEHSIYLDSWGNFYPCCWIGAGRRAQNLTTNFNNLITNWESKPDPVCQRTCGSQQGQTSFSNQWQREVQFV